MYRPEPRIERGTSRSYAWVNSLSANHTKDLLDEDLD